MKIKINTPITYQISPQDYAKCAKGHINTLPQNGSKVFDRIRIKEHTGTRYTGREILAVVMKADDEEIKFRKYAILDDASEGKQNKNAERRYEGDYETREWNKIV